MHRKTCAHPRHAKQGKTSSRLKSRMDLKILQIVQIVQILQRTWFEEPKQDKSVRRRFLNWLNDRLKERNMRKIAKAYRREQEEGDEIYRTSYMTRPITRAEREQRRRQKLIYADTQRHRVKELLDVHWEVKRYQKEAMRLKEEEHYEKWADEHDLSISDSSPGQPKKRMSKWEKRFLRVKELFSH